MCSLANLVAKLIYMECGHHDQLGTHCWNYQLWAHTHPVRVYRDNRRVPEDVYQRLVNSNYILNIARTPLLSDLTKLAPEDHRMEEAKRTLQLFLSDGVGNRGLVVNAHPPFLMAGMLSESRQRAANRKRESLIDEQTQFVEERYADLKEAYLEQEQTRVELRRKVSQLTLLH